MVWLLKEMGLLDWMIDVDVRGDDDLMKKRTMIEDGRAGCLYRWVFPTHLLLILLPPSKEGKRKGKQASEPPQPSIMFQSKADLHNR